MLKHLENEIEVELYERDKNTAATTGKVPDMSIESLEKAKKMVEDTLKSRKEIVERYKDKTILIPSKSEFSGIHIPGLDMRVCDYVDGIVILPKMTLTSNHLGRMIKEEE